MSKNMENEKETEFTGIYRDPAVMFIQQRHDNPKP